MNYLKLLSLCLLFSVNIFLAKIVVADSQFVAGDHYQVVAAQESEQPTLEMFFSYGCPACYQSESFIQRLRVNYPQLTIKLIPVSFNPGWDLYAKAFFIADKLNVMDKIHSKLFHYVHEEKKQITTEEQLKAFFVDSGVTRTDYNAVANSYWLNTQIRLSKQKTKKNKVLSAPSFLVNERYLLNSKVLANFNNLEAAMVELSKVKQ